MSRSTKEVRKWHDYIKIILTYYIIIKYLKPNRTHCYLSNNTSSELQIFRKLLLVVYIYVII